MTVTLNMTVTLEMLEPDDAPDEEKQDAGIGDAHG